MVTGLRSGQYLTMITEKALIRKESGKATRYKVFPRLRERTGLVARTVFKTAEAVARRLVGSIPTRSRHVSIAVIHASFARAIAV
jgi:hypothetical protein